MRYLYSADSDELVAHAPGRRDFFREGDDRVWAHESHGWLVAAESGRTLAHRTGDTYYGAVDGERLYRVSSEVDAAAPAATDAPDVGARPRRTGHRSVRTRQ